MDTVSGQELDAIVLDTRKYKLGAQAEDVNGNEFILVLYNEGDGADAGTEGHHVCFLESAYTPFSVTADVNSAVIYAARNSPAGQLQATAADGERVWAQYKGYTRKATITGAGISLGDRLMVHAGTTGALNTGDGAVAEVGTALAAYGAPGLAAGEVKLDIPL